MVVPSLSYFLLILIVLLGLWLGQHRWVVHFYPRLHSFRWDNLLLLVVSYVFYSLFDPRFALMLAAMTLVVYGCGIRIETTSNPSRQRAWVGIGLLVTVGLLCAFKLSLAVEHGRVSAWILPIGFSFYSLQSARYLLDIYQGQQASCRNLITFGLFLAFFPKLLAGPIERADSFLPQIEQPRRIEAQSIERGFFLILQGVFKKLGVVNLIALVIDPVLDSGGTPFSAHPALMLWGIMLLNTLYIYLDFTSYMDMAQGVGLCFGFELSPNFALPLFSPRVIDFWNRWHITLSTWLRDTLFLPSSRFMLRRGYSRTVVLALSYLITMLFSGLWHGVGWNFILWGGLHGILLFLSRSLWPAILPPQTLWDYLKRTCQLAFTFLAVNLLFILFVLPVRPTYEFMSQLLQFHSTSLGTVGRPLLLAVGVWLCLDGLEWWSGDKHGLYKLPAPFRGILSAGMVAVSIIGGLSYVQNFVYTQF